MDDGCSEQCGEPAPMDVAGVHEAVEGILGKGDSTAVKAHLHEERAMRECRREGDEEDTEDGEATEFVSVRRAQNAADVVTPEETRTVDSQSCWFVLYCSWHEPPLDVFVGA